MLTTLCWQCCQFGMTLRSFQHQAILLTNVGHFAISRICEPQHCVPDVRQVRYISHAMNYAIIWQLLDLWMQNSLEDFQKITSETLHKFQVRRGQKPIIHSLSRFWATHAGHPTLSSLSWFKILIEEYMIVHAVEDDKAKPCRQTMNSAALRLCDEVWWSPLGHPSLALRS